MPTAILITKICKF